MRIASRIFGLSALALILPLSMISGDVVDKDKDGHEKVKNINKSFDVKPTDTFYLRGGEGDVTIETWNQNKIQVDVEIRVRAEEEEAAQEFIDNADINVVEVATGVELNLSMCTNINVNTRNGKTKTKVKFKGEKWIHIMDYDIKVNVHMPRTNNVDLKSSYGSFDIGELSGNATLDIYDSHITTQDLLGRANIDVQYGTLTVGNLAHPERVKLYEVDFTCENAEGGRIESSYSTIRLGSWDKLELKSYEDKLYLGTLQELTGSATYTKLEAKKIEEIDAKFYEGKLDVDEVGSAHLRSQYTQYYIDKIGSISFEKGYEDKVVSKEIGSVNCKGNYINIRTERLTGSVLCDWYEGKLQVEELAPSVKSVKLQGNYTDASFGLHPDLVYDLDVDMQYPQLEYPEEDFESRVKMESSHVQVFLKNKNSSSKRATFTLRGYEGKVSFQK